MNVTVTFLSEGAQYLGLDSRLHIQHVFVVSTLTIYTVCMTNAVTMRNTP